MSNPSVTRDECEELLGYLGMLCRPWIHGKPRQLVEAETIALAERIARAYLALLDEQAWRDIETAPKDGTFVDLWLASPDRVEQWRETNCWWSADYKLWMNIRGRWDIATHWMPLPDPPRSAPETGAASNAQAPDKPRFRIGGSVPLNVYDGDRAVFQCHTPEDAAEFVKLLNAGASNNAPAPAGQPTNQERELADKLAAALDRHVKTHNCIPNGHIQAFQCSCDSCYNAKAALAEYTAMRSGK